MIEIRTQADLNKAMKKKAVREGDELLAVLGDGRFAVYEGSPRMEAWGSSSPTMEAWDSSSPTMVARDSSSPRMEARDSSSPRMEARGSSSPRMEAWGSSSPRMEAWGSSSPRMEAWESSSPRMEAWGSSSVTGQTTRYSQPRVWRYDKAKIKIPGSVIRERPEIKTAEDWCEYHGVEIREGGGLSKKLAGQDVAILYKALDALFAASHGITYVPGSTPEAPDWDGGKEECGGGLHFSPHPAMALEFNRDPKHFVACPVLVSEIVIHPDGTYPQKCKAPRVCAPCWECDRDGKRL